MFRTGRRSRSKGGCGMIIGAVFFTVIFSGFGVFMLAYLGPQAAQAQSRVASMPVVTASQLSDTPQGTDVILSGVLERNEQAEGGLVLYQKQRWDVEYDSDDGWEGSWTTISERVVPVSLTVDGREVRTSESGSDITWGGRRTEVIISTNPSGQRAEGHNEGDQRVHGYANGDTLTVVGSVTPSGRVAPERFHGGTPDDLRGSLRGETMLFFGLGGLFLAIGVIGGGIWLVSSIIPRFRG